MNPPEEMKPGNHAAESVADSTDKPMPALETVRPGQSEKDQCWHTYRRVVLADVPPTEQDVDRLAEVRNVLGISPEQMQDDVIIVTMARQLENLHASRAEHDEAAKTQREKIQSLNREIRRRRRRVGYYKVKREYHERLKDARQELQRLDELCQKAGFASDDLHALARRRPELFDTSLQPPRLLPAELDQGEWETVRQTKTTGKTAPQPEADLVASPSSAMVATLDEPQAAEAPAAPTTPPVARFF